MILDVDRIYHSLLSAGEDWADKNAAATLLEETKKTVLSKIMNATEAKSVAAQESIALASLEYLQHIERMVEARRVADRASVRYKSLGTLAELRRSEAVTRRVEAKLI
jgi:hypothetical protein